MKDDRLISLNAALDEVESIVDTMSVCISMDEWNQFVNTMKNLPYLSEIYMGEDNG